MKAACLTENPSLLCSIFNLSFWSFSSPYAHAPISVQSLLVSWTEIRKGKSTNTPCLLHGRAVSPNAQLISVGERILGLCFKSARLGTYTSLNRCLCTNVGNRRTFISLRRTRVCCNGNKNSFRLTIVFSDHMVRAIPLTPKFSP
jgi:hypothetical protein